MRRKSYKDLPLSVCLLSSQPAVLARFQKLLSDNQIRVAVFQLPPNVTPGFQPEHLPLADLYVADAGSPEGVTSALLRHILKSNSAARMLVIAETFTTDASHEFLRRGAKGLLTYEEAVHHLPKALSQVLHGAFWVPRTVLSGFVDDILNNLATVELMGNAAMQVTSREQQVLEALLKNRSNKEIASELQVSERTVKYHVSRLLEKFNVHRRADLILLCYQKQKSWPGEQ